MSQEILNYIYENLDVFDFLNAIDNYGEPSWEVTYETEGGGAYGGYNGGVIYFAGNEKTFKRWYKQNFQDEWEEMKDELEDPPVSKYF